MKIIDTPTDMRVARVKTMLLIRGVAMVVWSSIKKFSLDHVGVVKCNLSLG